LLRGRSPLSYNRAWRHVRQARRHFSPKNANLADFCGQTFSGCLFLCYFFEQTAGKLKQKSVKGVVVAGEAGPPPLTIHPKGEW
jgi:hypothetical protein